MKSVYLAIICLFLSSCDKLEDSDFQKRVWPPRKIEMVSNGAVVRTWVIQGSISQSGSRTAFVDACSKDNVQITGDQIITTITMDELKKHCGFAPKE